jgi:hypothetical protein
VAQRSDGYRVRDAVDQRERSFAEVGDLLKKETEDESIGVDMKIDLQTNADLQRFSRAANKRYFGGKLPIARIQFTAKLGNHCHGKTRVQKYHLAFRILAIHGKEYDEEVDCYHIEINTRLRRWRDLCMMTVYHEMVHAELDSLGFRGKELSCRKSGTRFNQRMVELAQAGAFNGLW